MVLQSKRRVASKKRRKRLFVREVRVDTPVNQCLDNIFGTSNAVSSAVQGGATQEITAIRLRSVTEDGLHGISVDVRSSPVES